MNNYEQKYKEALERAKIEMSKDGMKNDVIAMHLAETIFPELKESEDERIRKELLEHCKNLAEPYILTGNKCPQIQSWITWLEKQKQAEWDEDDKAFLDDILCKLEHDLILNKDEKDWLKSLKGKVQPQPKQEWSKEDDYYRNCIIQIIEEINNALLKRREDWDAYITWLKSLKGRVWPKPKWSEEDDRIIDNIETYINIASNDDHTREECIKETKDWIKSVKQRIKGK